MARAHTFGDALARATALDNEWGIQRHTDKVITRMLERVSAKATATRTGTLAKSSAAAKAIRPTSRPQALRFGGGLGVEPNRKAPTRPLRADTDAKLRAVADAVHAARKSDDVKVRAVALNSMRLEQLAAAVDAAVVAGKISGTDAVALLRRLNGKV